MKIILLLYIPFFIVLFTKPLSGQTAVYHPTAVKKAVFADVTPPLREMKLIQIRKEKNALDKEVPNKIGMKEFNNRVTQPFLLQEDPVWQKQNGTYFPSNSAPIQNFEGIGNLSGVYPPDTQGDVGPDKYIQVVNMNFAVYSKTGTVLLGPAAISTIFAGIPAPWNGTNNGDPVVLYDQAANRWIISEFSLPSGNYAELVAISQTSDPTGAWYRYVFQFGNKMPDYPKFGIWPDGYYLSVNQFVGGSTWGGVGACGLERAKMLTGDPTAQMVYFDLGASSDPWSMVPSDWDGTTAPITNEPNYFTYFNDWSSTTEDYLKIWQFHVNWTTTANSTFSEAYSLVTAPFDSEICTAYRGRCINQPGTSVKLESLSDRLMFRLQYRNFGGYRAMVTNHTVDVDGTGHAGIRWYELRNTGSTWTIYQQGTYSPDASHRWMGSVAMNASGDIALGYSVSNSTSVYPSIRYTGRRAGDALGQMTVTEQTIIDGTGNQTGSASRWGDYSGMSVDPTDDTTFWFTNEYIQTSGGANWKTRIASFKFNNSPSVTTLAATAITATSATLNGTINPNGLSSIYHFEWGTTISYGNSTASLSAGSGTSPVNINANISGLIPGSTYHFRVVGLNSDGTSYGNDLSFSSPGCTISGNYTYDNASATPLDNVKVVLMQGTTRIDSVQTNSSGTYTLNGVLNNTYTLKSYINKPWAGVNATDAIKIQRHFAGLEILATPVRIQAGDVNLSHSINATDAIKVKRRFSGLDTSFARGNWTFAEPTGGDTVIVNGANVLQDFQGLCVGDVNGSNVPVPDSNIPESPGCPGSVDTSWQVGGTGNSPSLVEFYSNGIIEVVPGQEFELPIKTRTDLTLSAISLVIPYPSEYLSIQSIIFNPVNPFYNITNNQIRFAWSELKPIKLKEGDTLLTLKLLAKECFTGDHTIEFNPNHESELADDKGDALSTTSLASYLIRPLKSFGVEGGNPLVTFLKVYPNPAINFASIEIELPHDAFAEINLINVLGNEVVHLQRQTCKTGENVIKLNLEDIDNGLYYIRTRISRDERYMQFTRKIVIRR